MKTRFFRIAMIAGLTLSMTTLTGCFKRTGVSAQDSTGLSNVGQPIGGNVDYNIVSGLSTAQVMNFRSVLSSYSTLTGVSPSSAALTIYRADAPTYSLDGAPTSVTSPMMFSQAKLASEMCSTLVTKEKALAAASRMFFVSTDFTKVPSGQMSTWLTDAAERLSRRWCGHDVSSSLASSISSDIVSSLGATTQDTVDASVILCTGYLSSACTLTNN
jgi:hypothetical protein